MLCTKDHHGVVYVCVLLTSCDFKPFFSSIHFYLVDVQLVIENSPSMQYSKGMFFFSLCQFPKLGITFDIYAGLIIQRLVLLFTV